MDDCQALLFGLGLPELVVIGGVAAILFGPSKLPELGKSLGKTVKSFQAAATVSATRPIDPPSSPPDHAKKKLRRPFSTLLATLEEMVSLQQSFRLFRN